MLERYPEIHRYICQARNIKDIYVNCHDLPDLLVHSANKQMKIDASVCRVVYTIYLTLLSMFALCTNEK